MAWLYPEFRRAASQAKSRQSQLSCEMVVIRMHDAWARFCREMVILSAYGNTITLAGSALPSSRPDIGDPGSVIPILLSLKKSKREPRWASATACIDAAQKLSIKNLTTVAAALGAANSPAEALRHSRNFYAHRGRDTSALALGTACFGHSLRPDVYDLNAYTAGGVTILESWVKGFDAVAVAALQ